MYSPIRTGLGLLSVSLFSVFILGSMYGFSYADRRLSSFGSILAFFFAFMLLFLVTFGLDRLFTSWRLEWNKWIVDVKEMGLLFNNMYWVWLIYHNHKKWAKWSTIIDLTLANLFVTLFAAVLSFSQSVPLISPESFWIGWTVATMLMIVFASTWYQYYIKVDRTPSPFPKAPFEDLPSRL